MTRMRPLARLALFAMLAGSLGPAGLNAASGVDDSDGVSQGQTSMQADFGIEFDTKGVDFNSWIKSFVKALKKRWPYATEIAAELRTEVRLTIARDGTVRNAVVTSGSSNLALDAQSVRALSELKSVKPLPSGYPDDQLMVRVTVHYYCAPRQKRVQ